MDPSSVRALACSAKQPFGQITDIVLNAFLDDHRSRSVLDIPLVLPANRCIEKIGRGRCRKIVARVALTQYCWKHQRLDSFCHPCDEILCHWNLNNLFQR